VDNRKALVSRIHALDFAILELGLFLDTNPCDEQALCKRREYLDTRNALIAAYEEQFGPYVVNSKQVKGDRWSWVDGPWPWEYGKEC
jgi:spore coat protein JB